MYNIWQIFKDDLRMLSVNAISILVIIGLVCLPSIYVWFNIAGSWNPYGNTNQLKIAFVNNDEGYSSDLVPMDVNLGDGITAMMTKNESFSWVFENYDGALNGVNNGAYYAAIVVPEDFSKQIMDILINNASSANLIYYQNEKLSAIAPKLTMSGANAIQQKLNKEFNEYVMSALLKTAKNLTDTLNSESFNSIANKCANAFGESSASLTTIQAQLQSTKTLINSIQQVLVSANNILPSNEGQDIEYLHNQIDSVRAKLAEMSGHLQKMIISYEEFGQTAESLRQLKSAVEDLLPVCDSAHRVCDDLVDISSSFKAATANFNELIADANNKIDRICNDLGVLSNDMKNAQGLILQILQTDSVEKIQQMLGSDTNRFATLLSAPVKFDRTAIWPVKNTGSSMAAFYTSLAIWVGCTILVAMMDTEVKASRLKKIKNKGPIRDRHLYFGRYLVFALISLLQTTLLCLGNIFFLQIQCVHPIYFFVVAYLTSLLFSLLIYTLVISFKNIGKAIALILLVLQVCCAGGVFPYEMIYDTFKIFYPFLPFTYTIDAFHCAIAGFSDGQIWLCMGYLILTLLPFILLLGLILRKPLKKGHAFIKEQTAKTHMM